MLSAILLLQQLWDNGTRETDNERSAQGTSAPLLPLLQRFQSILCSKDNPHAEGDPHVSTVSLLGLPSSVRPIRPLSRVLAVSGGASICF